MLPRVPPQTALAILANSIATGTEAENAKLPYPSETAAAVAEEYAAAARISTQSSWDDERLKSYVVSIDPVSKNFSLMPYSYPGMVI